MNNRISKNFHVPLNSLSSVKTAKSSLARGHMGGGVTGGTWSWDLGPRHGLGGPYTRKSSSGPTIRKEVLTPPPQKGYPGAGGYGGQNPKNHWGIIFGPKMMTLQGV